MSGATRVRLARITDLATLAALSQGATRSLGLPIGVGALSLFRLARMPLSLLRPIDLIWVHERDGTIDGLARIERGDRGDWSIVELAATGEHGGDTRHLLLGRVVREAVRAGAERIYVACAERDGNLDLFASNSFAPVAHEVLYLRSAEAASTPPVASMAHAHLRAAEPSDALRISLHHAAVTPPSVVRMELIARDEWDRAVRGSWAPRSSVTPLLRLVDRATFVVDSGATRIDGWIQIGAAREEGAAHPHSLRISLVAGIDPAPIIAAGLAEIEARAVRAGTSSNATLAVVRGYEAGLAGALESVGFVSIGELHLLVREVRARATAPRLIPAIG